jgi:Tol biopolymer transport system component
MAVTLNPVFIPIDTVSETQAGGIRSFDWSPDGGRLVFSSGHEGSCSQGGGLSADLTLCGQRVYVINADGTGLRRITRWQQPPYFDLTWIR